MNDAKTPDNTSSAPPDTKIPWLELAKLSHEDFKNRRELEWKLLFGLWTAIATFTYFAIFNKMDFGQNLGWLGSLYVFAFLMSAVWLIPLQKAHADNRAYWKYYMDKAEQLQSCDGKRVQRPILSWKSVHILWAGAQLGFTGIFLFLSWFLIITKK
jgi:hypothetical protein